LGQVLVKYYLDFEVGGGQNYLAQQRDGLEKEPAMQDEWQYKLLIGTGFRNHLQDADGVKYGKLSQELLNKLGKEGWEVCGLNSSAVSPVMLILKRKVLQQT
jgi:hypothetical protein